MAFYQILELISFFAGMLIHFLLVGQSLKRQRKNKSGLLFFLLMLASGMWYFGVFATSFLDILFGPNNISVIIITSSFSLFVVGGLSLLPSLLIHTLVSFFFEKELNFDKKIQTWIEWGMGVVYFPLLFFPLIIYQLFVNTTTPYEIVLAPYLTPFSIWLIAVFLMAHLLCLKISRVGWESEERNLFFALSGAFLIIAGILGSLIYISFHPSLMGYKNGLLLIASLLPTLVFSFYVYKYNYMDFIIRRGILYSILITTVVLLYLYGVDKFTEYVGQRYEINGTLLQSLLVLGLVFAFRPFRTHTAEMLDRFFFKEHEIYKKVYRNLTQQIRGGSQQDMPALLRHIVQVLKKTMNLDHASLVFFEKDGEKFQVSASTLPFQMEDFAHIVEYIESQKLKILHRYDVEKEEVLREMDSLGALTIIPIYLDQELMGLFPVGKKTNNRRIHSEELEILILLSNQLVTEIKNMQLLEEKFRLERELLKNEKFLALGRLSASVAHQVKNPLSSIKIIAQVLREDLPPDDQREEDLTLVINEVDKLTRVVNQLLEFAKPARQDFQQSNLEQVIDEVVVLMQYEANRYNVKIKKDIPPHLPPLRADRTTLQDIFSNLIQNGIQALEKRGGEIQIKTHFPPLAYPGDDQPALNAEKTLTLEIRDNGMGIKPENLKNIFEPFYTTKQQGTGLGLPIVHQRLKSLGAQIKIESALKKTKKSLRGTVVYLWLPLV